MAWVGLLIILYGSFMLFYLARRKGDRKRTSRDLFDPNRPPMVRTLFYVMGMIFIVLGIFIIISTIE